MALETLKGVKKVGKFDVVVMDDLRNQYPEMFNEYGAMNYEYFEKNIRPNKYIFVRNDVNSISFTIQKGTVEENGINGCQVDSLIRVAKIMIENLNKKFPCDENENTIKALEDAIQWQEKRTLDREKRKVEGYNKL